MSDLIQEAEALSREQVLEAAEFFGQAVMAAQPAGPPEGRQRAATDALEAISSQPYRNVSEVEELARLTLVIAAATPGFEQAVRDAIAGAGKKQFILGGTEIVAISVVALGALSLVLKDSKLKVEKKGDSFSIEYSRTSPRGISSAVADVLRKYFGLGK